MSNGIEVGDSFVLLSIDGTPLDKRVVVENLDELQTMTKFAYPGMIVWVKNINSQRIAVPSGMTYEWQELHQDLVNEIANARGTASSLGDNIQNINNNIINIQASLENILPPYSSADAGKWLFVGTDGKLYWGTQYQPQPDVTLTFSFRTNLDSGGYTPGTEVEVNKIIYSVTITQGDISLLKKLELKVGTDRDSDNVLPVTSVTAGSQQEISLSNPITILNTTTFYATLIYEDTETRTKTASQTITFSPVVYYMTTTLNVDDITEQAILEKCDTAYQSTRNLTHTFVEMKNERWVYAYPKEFGKLTSMMINGIECVSGVTDKDISFKLNEITINSIPYYVYIKVTPNGLSAGMTFNCEFK